MLNAFRHHGEGDRKEEREMTKTIMCSTPFGITARGTLAGCLVLVGASPVLNAFRHHGEGDYGNVETLTVPPSGCSTPFGITARGT